MRKCSGSSGGDTQWYGQEIYHERTDEVVNK